MNLQNIYLITVLLVIKACFFPLLAQDRKSLDDQLYSNGKKEYLDGNYEKASTYFLECYEIRKDSLGDNHLLAIKARFRLAKCYRRLRWNKKALKYFLEGYELPFMKMEENKGWLTDFYIETAIVYSQMYIMDKSESYFEKVLELRKEKYGYKSSEVANSFMEFGNINVKLGHFKKADSYFREAHKIFKEVSAPKSKDFYRIYNNHGILYRKTNDLAKASEYAKKALEIKLIHYDSLHPGVTKYYSNLAQIYVRQDKPRKAISLFEKAYEINFNKYGERHTNTIFFLESIADQKYVLGDTISTLETYKKMIALKEQLMDPDHPYVLASYFMLAKVYYETKDFSECLKIYNSILESLKNNSSDLAHYISKCHRGIAKVHLKTGEYESAKKECQLAFENLTKKEFGVDSMFIEGVENKIEYLKILNLYTKVNDRSYFESGEKGDLISTLKTGLIAIELIDEIKSDYQSDYSKQLLLGRNINTYGRAVDAAYILYLKTNDKSYLEQAFKIISKCKATILWRNMNSKIAFEHGNIPTELSDSLRFLRNNIFDIEQLGERQTLDQKLHLAAYKEKYDGLVKEIEQEYPEYYALKYKPKTISINDLQTYCENEDILVLDYFYTDRYFYNFLIDQDSFQVSRNIVPDDFKQNVSNLRDWSFTMDQSDHDKYISANNALYDLLVQPNDNYIYSFNKLIVIPYQRLNLISIESLFPQSSSKDYRAFDYLIKSHEISYNWNVAFLLNDKIKKQDYEFNYVGFAPTFDKKDGFSDELLFRDSMSYLKNSKDEVYFPQKYFRGKIFTDSSASKNNFLKFAPKSRIVHCATHAIANDYDPMKSSLFFTNDGDFNLNADEIQQLQLSSDLVVLSACNTGVGQIQAGEGVISLGRSFIQSGSQSVITSLWLANDHSSSQILKSFYKNIANGKTKSYSIAEAKRSYLDSADQLAAHPFFWSNMTLWGDTQEMNVKGTFSKFKYLFLLLLIPIYFLIKRQRILGSSPKIN